jgi:rod shape-determining protein MreC
VKTRNNGSVVRIAAPFWGLMQRFYFPLLVLAAVALMMIGHVNVGAVDQARARVTDAFTPILNVMSRPAASVADALEYGRQLVDLHEENARLREENTRLRQWEQVALRLEAENGSLRSLLAFKADPPARFITARVVGDPGGAFVRTVVITAGARDGVERGQAAMSGQGLVGRVVQVGEWSSRVLLITDLNARIPVVLETSRQRAMLAGDNSDHPTLLYVPGNTAVSPGERVFTSGHGGLFPPGLPVGVMEIGQDGQPHVVPMADLSRLEHLQIVRFGGTGGLAAEAAQPGAMQ